MTKVTMVETPTQEIIRESATEFTVTDKKGRSIVLKKPNVLAQFKLVKLVGGETAKNEVYMSMILPLLYVSSVDNQAVSLNSEAELNALILRLGDEGIEAIIKGMQEKFQPSDSSEGSPEGAPEQIKK